MEEKDPHNYRAVGLSMIVVASGLAGIGLIALFIGGDVLYADTFQRDKTIEFNECKENDFTDPVCDKYRDRVKSDVSGIILDDNS